MLNMYWQLETWLRVLAFCCLNNFFYMTGKVWSSRGHITCIPEKAGTSLLSEVTGGHRVTWRGVHGTVILDARVLRRTAGLPTSLLSMDPNHSIVVNARTGHRYY